MQNVIFKISIAYKSAAYSDDGIGNGSLLRKIKSTKGTEAAVCRSSSK